MNIPSATHHANGDAGHNPTAKVVCPKEKNNRFYQQDSKYGRVIDIKNNFELNTITIYEINLWTIR